MDKKTIDTLTQVSDAITDHPIRFEITIRPQNKLHAWLQSKGLRPKKKEFSIQPIVYGNLVRISSLLLPINLEALKGKNILGVNHQLVSDHAMTMIEILAIAIQGNRMKPSEKLLRLLTDNLTPAEVMKILQFVLAKMDLKCFMSSIISMRGLNVLDGGEQKKNGSEVSPMIQER